MKHLLNNMTEEEKNAIREQHAGGMKVMIENFSKLVSSRLGDSKPLVSEQVNEWSKYPCVSKFKDANDSNGKKIKIGTIKLPSKEFKITFKFYSDGTVVENSVGAAGYQGMGAEPFKGYFSCKNNRINY
jgi:hypothetical protein